ncbi:MAG: IucA/IucC family C-terminal-domain containing protein [Anaerolineales bacterium]
MRVDIGPLESGYFPVADLTTGTTSHLEAELARQGQGYPEMDVRTQAAFFVNEYAWYLAMATAAPLLSHQRAPDVAPENVALRISRYTWHEDGASGEAERYDVRFRSGRFACLASDPAANHPDATSLQDTDALLAWLRGRIETHFAPLIARVHAISHLSQSALWRLVADAYAGQALNVGKHTGQVERAQTLGLALIKADKSPLSNPQTGYITLTCAGYTDTFRERGGCCRYYTVAEDGDKCGTCVLRPPENRKQWFLDHMTRTSA